MVVILIFESVSVLRDCQWCLAQLDGGEVGFSLRGSHLGVDQGSILAEPQKNSSFRLSLGKGTPVGRIRTRVAWGDACLGHLAYRWTKPFKKKYRVVYSVDVEREKIALRLLWLTVHIKKILKFITILKLIPQRIHWLFHTILSIVHNRCGSTQPEYPTPTRNTSFDMSLYLQNPLILPLLT